MCGSDNLCITHKVGQYGAWTVLYHCWGCGGGLDDVSAASGIARHLLLRWPPPKELGPPVQHGRAAGGEVEIPSQAQVDGWVEALWANPRALSYLRDTRGLTDETILQYELGCRDGEAIVMPVWNEKGGLVNLKLRFLDPAADPKTLNGPGSANLYPDMPPSQGVLFVGGEMDALIGRQMNLPTVTPTCGPHAPPWIRNRFKGKRVFVMLDVGEDMAASMVASKLRGIASEVRVVDLGRIYDKPKGDLNDFYLEGGTREQVHALIRREWRAS